MTLTPWCLLAFATFAAPVESVAVEVDASSIEPEGPGITRQLGGKVNAALTEQGISVDGASSTLLRVEVRKTGVMSYDVALMVEVDGEVASPGLENVTCDRCTLMKMDEAVLAKLPDAIALMEQSAEPEPVAKAGELEVAPDVEVTEDAGAEPAERQEPTQPRKARVLGPLGITGIVTGGLGLGAVIAGATLMSREPRVERDVRAPEFEVVRDFDRSGRILLGVGATATIVGGALLVVDLVALRRGRGGLARVPRVLPTLGGVVIKGRF